MSKVYRYWVDLQGGFGEREYVLGAGAERACCGATSFPRESYFLPV